MSFRRISSGDQSTRLVQPDHRQCQCVPPKHSRVVLALLVIASALVLVLSTYAGYKVGSL